MPLVIAHRGASSDFPENSREAVTEAYRLGTDMIEVDIRHTRDGKLVLCHDSHLHRLFGDKSKLASIDSEQFRRMRTFGTGTTVTLDELLQMHETPMQIILDVKEYGLEKRIDELIRKHDCVDRVIVSSFYSAVVRWMKQLNPSVRTALIMDKLAAAPMAAGFSRMYFHFLKAIRSDYLHVHFSRSRIRTIRKLGRLGIPTAFWTLDDPKDILASLPANPYGIMSNSPRTAMKALGRLRAHAA